MRKLNQALWALILTICLAAPAAVRADDMGTVCGKITPSSQKSQYCAAAKDAKKAADTNGTLWKIYAGVTAICTTVCAASAVGMGLGDMASYACTGSSVAAGVADGMMTKDYMTAAMSVGGAVAGIAYSKGWLGIGPAAELNEKAAAAGKEAAKSAVAAGENLDQVKQASNQAEQGVKDAAKAKGGTDWGSCLTAAMSAYSTFTKHQSATQAQDTEKQNLNLAKQVNDNTNNNNRTISTYDPGTGSTAVNTGSGGGSTAANLATGTTDSGSQGSNPCGGSNANSLAGAIACAATADPGLAKKLSNPNFAKDFQKVAGMPFDQFMQGAGSLGPKNAIEAGMGGALNGDGIGKMDAALAKMQSQMPDFNSNPAGTYAGGGGGGDSGSGDPSLGSIMGNIMGQFAKKGSGPNSANPNAVIFNKTRPQRSLASVTPEDTTVSLFDRVTYRYAVVMPSLLLDPSRQTLKDWGTPAGSGPSLGTSPSLGTRY